MTSDTCENCKKLSWKDVFNSRNMGLKDFYKCREVAIKAGYKYMSFNSFVYETSEEDFQKWIGLNKEMLKSD